jgi:cell wall-associated NlpC family hydrolase
MRRLMVVLLAAVSASLLISFVAVAAGAQTETTDPSSSGDPTQQESTAPAPEDTTGDSQPYHQVVDNATARSFDAPGWQVGPANESTYGQDFAYADPADQVGPARFTVDIPEADNYAVFARWPGGADVTTLARFDIDTGSGTSSDEVDQQTDAGLWILVGIYEMQPGQRTIEISRTPSGDGRLVTDAVMVVGGAMIAPDGQTATSADPYELAGDPAGEAAFSADGRRGRPSGRAVVRKAARYRGAPYAWGQCDTRRGMSCTCLTKRPYAKFGIKLPMTESGQWKAGRSRKVDRSNLKPGDEVFFTNNRGRLNHVGVYAGNGRFWHSSAFCNGVCLGEMRYVHDYRGAKRYRLR